MIDASEIKAAVDLMTAEDFKDGVPNLQAVQRVCGNDKITAEDVANAMKPAAVKEGDGGTKVKSAKADSPGPGTGGTPPKSVETIIVATGGAQDGAAHSLKPDPDADKEDGTGDGRPDPAVVARATAAAAQEKKGEVQAALDKLAQDKEALEAKIKEGETERAKLETVIEENLTPLSDAEMIKRIQKQTQDRLTVQAEAKKKLEGTMAVAGLKTYASPLDQALAGGAKRSKVLQPDGKVFEAPHPRSPEGIKSYGNWIHHGARQPA